MIASEKKYLRSKKATQPLLRLQYKARLHVALKKEDQIAEQGNSRRKRWETRVQASSEMWCDEQFFYVKNQLTASHYSKEI